jgi:hypothetical protein
MDPSLNSICVKVKVAEGAGPLGAGPPFPAGKGEKAHMRYEWFLISSGA